MGDFCVLFLSSLWISFFLLWECAQGQVHRVPLLVERVLATYPNSSVSNALPHFRTPHIFFPAVRRMQNPDVDKHLWGMSRNDQHEADWHWATKSNETELELVSALSGHVHYDIFQCNHFFLFFCTFWLVHPYDWCLAPHTCRH